MFDAVAKMQLGTSVSMLEALGWSSTFLLPIPASCCCESWEAAGNGPAQVLGALPHTRETQTELKSIFLSNK